MSEYRVKLGDTINEVARRFGLAPNTLADLNDLKTNNDLVAGKNINLRAPEHPTEDYSMSNDTDDQSQHAADHIEGIMSEMDAAFDEVKATAKAVRASLRAEAKEMQANMGLFDQRVVGRMRSANSRFRAMLGNNGGPPLDDTKVIEHNTEE